MRWFVLLPLILAPVVAAAAEARILYLKHRPAEEIIPVIRPLLGPNDLLNGNDYRLIIRAPDAKLKEIECILAQLDVARRQLRITVQQGVSADETAGSQSLSGETRIGEVRVTLPDKPGNDRGLVVQKNELRYNINNRTTFSDDIMTQTVLTQDGQRAYIRIGQSLPHVQRILALSRNQLVISEGIEMQDVTTGFTVVPHVHGDGVRIDITPRLSTLQDPSIGLAKLQELSMTIDAKLGEWIDLGEILGQRDDIERAILESGSTGAGERRTVRMKIE